MKITKKRLREIVRQELKEEIKDLEDKLEK